MLVLHKDQSSVPRTHVKVLVVHTGTPNAGDMEISRPGVCSQCSLTSVILLWSACSKGAATWGHNGVRDKKGEASSL